MESTRLQKIERLLQKELSDIFQKQTQGMHGVLVSVSVVRVSPDLSIGMRGCCRHDRLSMRLVGL